MGAKRPQANVLQRGDFGKKSIPWQGTWKRNKNPFFEKFSGATKQPKQQEFWAISD